MTVKSEDSFRNMSNTVHWQDCWWLLDVETSGLDREKDSITALRLARLEQLGIPSRQNSRKLLKALPAPPGSWPDVPPENADLVQMYRLTRAVFYQLEEMR